MDYYRYTCSTVVVDRMPFALASSAIRLFISSQLSHAHWTMSRAFETIVYAHLWTPSMTTCSISVAAKYREDTVPTTRQKAS